MSLLWSLPAETAPMVNYNLICFETSFADIGRLFPSDRPEIVFSGRSNVGKSTLINKVCGRKSLARVGNTPGKTVTINFYSHPKFRLVDLPGYGYARRGRQSTEDWSGLMEHYFKSGRDIRLVCALVDSRREPTPHDAIMIDFLEKTGTDFVIAAAKTDKLSKEERAGLYGRFPERLRGRIIPVSAVTGEGIDELRARIEKAAEKGK